MKKFNKEEEEEEEEEEDVYDDDGEKYPNYGRKSYWEKRYAAEEQPYDWYFRWDEVSKKIEHLFSQTDRVLVIGCGTSTMSVEMHASGRFPHIMNIDISTVAIEKMQAQTAGVAGLEWAVMSCTKMDFPDATFDMVFDKGTIDAVVCQTKGNECASQTLAEVHRVLKPGGRFILISFGGPAQRLAVFKREKLDWTLLPPLHIHRYEDYDPSDSGQFVYAFEKPAK